MAEKEVQGNTAVKVRPAKVKKPSRWGVVLFNDDVTTMEFVVMLLVEVFNKTEDDAVSLMMKVHQEGSAIVGIYNKDIAETLRAVALEKVSAAKFPLKIELIEV